jgi:hypothetical protein
MRRAFSTPQPPIISVNLLCAQQRIIRGSRDQERSPSITSVDSRSSRSCEGRHSMDIPAFPKTFLVRGAPLFWPQPAPREDFSPQLREAYGEIIPKNKKRGRSNGTGNSNGTSNSREPRISGFCCRTVPSDPRRQSRRVGTTGNRNKLAVAAAIIAARRGIAQRTSTSIMSSSARAVSLPSKPRPSVSVRGI